MFIFWHSETSASMEVTSPTTLWTPFSWDAIHMDLYRTGYSQSIVLLENTRQSSGFLRSSRSAQTDLKEMKTLQVKQHNTGGYKTGRIHRGLCSLKNVQWPLRAHIGASVSPSVWEAISQAVLEVCSQFINVYLGLHGYTDWRCCRKMKYE